MAYRGCLCCAPCKMNSHGTACILCTAMDARKLAFKRLWYHLRCSTAAQALHSQVPTQVKSCGAGGPSCGMLSGTTAASRSDSGSAFSAAGADGGGLASRARLAERSEMPPARDALRTG